jgi:hypothetical protein
MALYRIVQRLLEEHYVEADTPGQAKDQILGKPGHVYDVEVMDIECIEGCGQTIVITEPIVMKRVRHQPTEE